MSSGGPVGLRRVEAAKVVEHRDSTLVLGPDGRVHRFPADSGALVAELMRLLSRTRTRDELVAALAERFDDVSQNAQTIDAAIEHLKQAGAVASLSPGGERAGVRGSSSAPRSLQPRIFRAENYSRASAANLATL